jgi:predicted TPR repeat methyltransferase
LSRLLAEDTPSDETDELPSLESPASERAPSLHDQRLQTVLSVIRETGAKRVVDLGCGEGKLLKMLLSEKQFETILGTDVSWRSLETAKERLRLDELPERQRSRIELIQGSLILTCSSTAKRLGGLYTGAFTALLAISSALFFSSATRAASIMTRIFGMILKRLLLAC